MKKLTVCLMAAFLSLTFIPAQLKAGTETIKQEMKKVPMKDLAKAEAYFFQKFLNSVK